MGSQLEVAEHQHGGQDHRDWIRQSATGDIGSGSVGRLEDGVVLAEVHAGGHAEAADEPGTEVGDYVSVKIGQHYDIEILRVPREPHREFVDLDGVEVDVRIIAGQSLAGL